MSSPTRPGEPSVRPEFRALFEAGARRHLRPGSVLYREGEEPASAFALHRGLVKLVKTAPSGAQSLAAFRGAGGLVGEHPVIDGQPRLTTAVVVADAVVSEVPNERLREAVGSDPSIALALLIQFAGHVRAATQQVLAVSTGDVLSLVAARLAELATNPIFEPLRTTHHDVMSIEMPISQHELATWAGVSQRSVAGALRELRDAGTVTTGRLNVHVHDLDALEASATGRTA